MAQATFYGTTNSNPDGWASPENIYAADDVVTGFSTSSFPVNKYMYAGTFGIVGTNSGQIPPNSLINWIQIEGRGRTTTASSSVGIQARVDSAAYGIEASQGLSGSLVNFNTGQQAYKTGTTAWSTDDLDDASFEIIGHFYKGSAGTTAGYLDYARVLIDYYPASIGSIASVSNIASISF